MSIKTLNAACYTYFIPIHIIVWNNPVLVSSINMEMTVTVHLCHIMVPTAGTHTYTDRLSTLVNCDVC